MTKISNSVQKMIDLINPRMLRNNTQRVLFAMLRSEQEWISRTSFRVPSASSRLRDLRKEEFGSFDLKCARPRDLNRPVTARNRRSTFYKLNPRSVTRERILTVFEGVVETSTTR